MGPGATVADVIQCLWHNKAGVAVVIDDRDTVVGTVTDDNVRRAVMAGIGTDSGVAQVISERPITAPSSSSDSAVEDVLRSFRLPSIPLLDDGKLVGIASLQRVADAAMTPVAVIMAGGRGLRLRPLTDKVPKPLLKVGARSIIENILSGLAAAGVRDVYLAVNYKAEQFEQRLGSGERLGVSLHYLHEEQAMGTAGALSMLPPLEGPILVSNGDIVTTVDFTRLLDFHWRHAAAITVAAAPYLSHIPYGVLRTVEHHLLSIDEKPTRRDFCSAGIYVIEPYVLRQLNPQVARDMPDVIAAVLSQGLPVSVFPILERWYDIGSTAEFERVLVQFATGDDGT